ncbi:MAG TPA: DUF4105 domain-containing protein [Saprospiraceae bacterium]|nr:DUF4105 domain-containing protein [Saprospiraceae bacterium]
MIKKIFFLLFFFFAQASQGQDYTISLLTCSPGSELYSTYGHSAILVEDNGLHRKTVYNYGTFDFNTPHFAIKFIKGNLLYMLSPERYNDFIYEYQYQGRGIIAQELEINPAQKRKVVAFLANNLKPENRTYLYDFFFDNCSTRIRDLFEKELGIQYPGYTPKSSFRTLLKPYLSDTPWYHFGTDLILGRPTDDIADFRNEMFLPDYLSKNLAQATIDGHLLLKPAQTLLPRTYTTEPSPVNTPLFTMIGILLLSLLVSFKGGLTGRKIFDTILFGAAALSGLLFTFMWTSTQHEVCYENYNLLWANPLFFFLPIFALRKKETTWKVVFGYTVLVGLLWFLVPQKLPVAQFFFLLALIVRSGHHAKLFFKSTNS